jgi:hypothetical protein
MVSIISGLAGGLVATIIMTGFMMAMGDDSPPPTALLWSKYVGSGESNQYMMQGMALHFIYGIIAGGVFAAISLGIGLGIGTLAGGLLWGFIWGLVLFVIGAAFWMMMVLDMSPDRQMVMGFGLFHIVYGLVLGAWIGFGILG